MVATPERRVSRAPLRVLLVEDSEDDALLLLRALRRHGYETVCERVQTPGAMREALAASSWDVILSDYRMPRFSAAEALKLAQGAGSEAPFIVVSGRIGEDAAVETMRAGVYDYVMKNDLARLWSTVERGLEETKARRELARREAILDAVRFAADQFLGEALSWEESVRTVLRRLGEAAGASRAYIFESHTDADGEPRGTLRYEWVAKGIPSQMGNLSLQAIAYRTVGYGRWIDALRRGEPVHGHTREFPKSERWALWEQGILSVVVVPIFVEGRFWGHIGFDECREEREWSAAEIGALGAAGGTLGAAIRRRKTEDRLRQSEERYRAVVEQATDGVYLLDVESRRLVESNPAFQNMFGYKAEEARRMEIYDLVAHPREDVDGTIGRTLQERRRLVGERKYRRKDGTLLDVEVGVSVISPEGRDVICTIVRDVTGRKKDEEALRTSEAELRALFEAMTDLIFVINGEGRHLKVAPTNPLLLYRPPTEIVGKTLHDIFPAGQADEFLGHVRQVLRTRRSVHFEYSLVANEEELWFQATVSPMLEDSVVWVAHDVTGRKRDEEALARSESRLRQIIETEPECVKVLGANGALLEMNPAGLSMIEADSLEQVRGRSVYRYIAPGHRKAFVALTEEVLRGGSGTLEFELVGLKGTRRWLETHAVPLRDAGGGTSGLLAITRDISERKKAEHALKQSERLHRAVIEQATENIFLVDVETKSIVESNTAFCEAMGYAEEELLRMTLYDVVDADREGVDANIRRVSEQRSPFVGERRYRRKDGSLLDVEVSASVVLRGGRETLCVVAHDVTERAKMQKLLQERVETLSRVAASLTLDQPVESTLDTLAASMVRASGAVACVVLVHDEATGGFRLIGSHGLPEGYADAFRAAYKGDLRSRMEETFSSRRSSLLREARRTVLEDPAWEPLWPLVRGVAWDTLFTLRLDFREKVVGSITFYYLPEQEPSEDEKGFLQAVADQAAVAVENARLFSEARGKAALEERQRLARELHDSVSQALYGIALGLETARDLLPQNPVGAAEPLDYAATLTEAGMTEMRALIFELRPESLETEGLVAALRKQAASVQQRHGIRIEAALAEEPAATLETKEALYRIAQEALHNTVKHARANNVKISLERHPGWIVLEVTDDGRGFDTRGDFSSSLGLKSMRERASRLGGSLSVESGPGQGACVLARLPFE